MTFQDIKLYRFSHVSPPHLNVTFTMYFNSIIIIFSELTEGAFVSEPGVHSHGPSRHNVVFVGGEKSSSAKVIGPKKLSLIKIEHLWARSSTFDDFNSVTIRQKFQPGPKQVVHFEVGRKSSYANFSSLFYSRDNCVTVCKLNYCSCETKSDVSLDRVDHFKIRIRDSKSSCFCGLLQVNLTFFYSKFEKRNTRIA